MWIITDVHGEGRKGREGRVVWSTIGWSPVAYRRKVKQRTVKHSRPFQIGRQQRLKSRDGGVMEGGREDKRLRKGRCIGMMEMRERRTADSIPPAEAKL
jgi:hypothetical protein